MSLADDLKKIVGIKPRYPHIERDLAHTYGLAPEALRDARTAHLQRGAHWDLIKGLVCYNDRGRAAIEEALKITAEKNPAETAAEPPTPPPAPADSAPNAWSGLPGSKGDTILGGCRSGKSEKIATPVPPPAAGEVRTLVAVAKVRNKRILKARDQDRVAWVRVRDSKNFRAGMELQAKFISGEQWELIGRCPRWNGKF